MGDGRGRVCGERRSADQLMGTKKEERRIVEKEWGGRVKRVAWGSEPQRQWRE